MQIAPLERSSSSNCRQANSEDWRLVVDGTVAHPLALSLADLRSLPMHSQITEVACEEGWSYIAEWIGTPLSNVLREAGVLPQTRYVVYFTRLNKELWESIDMADAWIRIRCSQWA